MRRINLNELAKRITAREGLREPLSIAQVKEVLRITLDELHAEWSENPERVIELLLRKRKEKP